MKRKVANREALQLLLMNLVPLAGVIGLGWDPVLIFIFYALETLVAGVFNLPKIFLTSRQHPSGTIPVDGQQKHYSAIGLMFFFTFHYGFFVFVQLTIFFGILSMSNYDIPGVSLVDSFLGAPVNIARVAGQEMGIVLGFMGFTYLMSFVSDYVIGHKAREMTPAAQMFEPYPRIFVQQFVVILAGWIMIIQFSGLPFLILFVAIKTIVDYLMLLKGPELVKTMRFE